MQALGKLARFIKPYWLFATLAPLLMVLEVAMDLMQPRLLQNIVDNGIAHNNMAVVTQSGIGMVLCAAMGLIGGVGCGLAATKAALSQGADLRRAVFEKVQSLSFGNLDKLETGGLVTRLTNDVTQIQDVWQMMLRMMVRVPFLLVGSLIMAILTSPTLALIFFVMVPIVIGIMVLLIRKIFPLFGEVQKKLDGVNTVLQENLAGVRVVKAFARALYEMKRFGDANDNLMDWNIRAARIGAVTMPLIMFVLNCGTVAALWIGGLQVSSGHLQVGHIIAFTNYLMQTMMSLMMVSMLIIGFSRSGASAVRLQEVLEMEPEVKVSPDALKEFDAKGRVCFENVSFRYNADETDLVLKDLSFVVEAGQTVAILGATGSGKSSLVQLIPRFYDVADGRVTIDGHDVRDLSPEAIGEAVVVALQESVLFSGTVRDNIRYGRPEASDEEVIRAAKVAQADGFIHELPDGYDALIGQRGVNLSGGQKQRIAIARALLPAPAVLILDDSTSAVDVQNEALIHAGIAEYRRDRTCIIVAQRVSTVLNADKILVLDDGMLVAEGPHDQLMETSPVYREIFESQMNGGVVTADAIV